MLDLAVENNSKKYVENIYYFSRVLGSKLERKMSRFENYVGNEFKIRVKDEIFIFQFFFVDLFVFQNFSHITL